MWLADVQRFADLPYVLVHDPATVIDNVDVDRITHLCIGASGIHLKHSLVLAAFGVGELLRELIFLLILCGFFLGTALASLPSMLILVPCRLPQPCDGVPPQGAGRSCRLSPFQ